jgi:lipid-A-disaccharide synthase
LSHLIYIAVGEHSGDVLGARLIAALRARRPDLRFCGIGGPRMAEHGFETLFPMQLLAVMGLVEILPRVLKLNQLLDQAAADIARKRPDVVVTIDSPGFMLRLLKRIRPLNLKRAHYVAPQVWAWRERRVRSFPGLWNTLLCLLPFEPPYFADHNVSARFVGHPVLQSGADQGDHERFRARYNVSPLATVILLMPGSRRTEVTRLLPIFGETLERLAQTSPELVAVLPVPLAVAGHVEAAVAGWKIRPIIVTELADKHDAFATASAALTKSGTSTLELALAGVPMAVTYRVNPITGWMARRMIRVPFVAMVNLLALRPLVPELLQQDCTPERLAATLLTLLSDQRAADTQRAGFREVIARLAPAKGEPADAAAAAVLELLDGS